MNHDSEAERALFQSVADAKGWDTTLRADGRWNDMTIYGAWMGWQAAMSRQAPVTLTDAQCDEFRRHPGTFNDMVRQIYRAGAQHAYETPKTAQVVPDLSQEGGKGNTLGFVIDGDILRWDDGGCRPASSEEMAMWEALPHAGEGGTNG